MNTYAGFCIREGEQGRQDREVIEEVYVSDTYHLREMECRVKRPLIVDIGAHIGAFAQAARRSFPDAEILCVEACPENMPLLCTNVTPIGAVAHHAACSYSPEPMALWNSVLDGEESAATGGSQVRPRWQVEREAGETGFWKDLRTLPTVTIEALTGGRWIDLLKVDAEGSELDILAGCDLRNVGTIIGEYHQQWEWERFRVEHLPDWPYRVFHLFGGLGTFTLRRVEGYTIWHR